MWKWIATRNGEQHFYNADAARRARGRRTLADRYRVELESAVTHYFRVEWSGKETRLAHIMNGHCPGYVFATHTHPTALLLDKRASLQPWPR